MLSQDSRRYGHAPPGAAVAGIHRHVTNGLPHRLHVCLYPFPGSTTVLSEQQWKSSFSPRPADILHTASLLRRVQARKNFHQRTNHILLGSLATARGQPRMDGYQKLGKPPIVRPAALVGGLLY
jgi:hypothetical protein